MGMNKTNSSIDENEESLVGEVLSDDEVREKKQAIAKWQHSPVGFGSYITKSNDLIQRTKYSLPRNEQKVLFMLMSKIDQKNDKDASKYYSITFNDFAKLTGVRTVDTTYALNLKETIENLENRTFWLKKEPGSKVYRSISWLQKGSEVDFDKKEIRLRFNQDIWKDIAQLTSNYTSYSIEYLLKPIEESDLEAALCKFERNSALRSAAPEYRQLELGYLAANKKNRFLVQVGDTFRYVETPDVAFFYSEDKLTYLHLFSGKRYIISYSLDQLEGMLDRDVFFRVSRSCISNIRSIRKSSRYFGSRLKLYFEPECPHEVLVSRSRVADFLKWVDGVV